MPDARSVSGAVVPCDLANIRRHVIVEKIIFAGQLVDATIDEIVMALVLFRLRSVLTGYAFIQHHKTSSLTLSYHRARHRQLAQLLTSPSTRGWPIAPARCSAAVSIERTQSIAIISAAQSAKSSKAWTWTPTVRASAAPCFCTECSCA